MVKLTAKSVSRRSRRQFQVSHSQMEGSLSVYDDFYGFSLFCSKARCSLISDRCNDSTVWKSESLSVRLRHRYISMNLVLYASLALRPPLSAVCQTALHLQCFDSPHAAGSNALN